MRQEGRLPAFLRPGGVKVVAHRGGGGLAPENTLEAFRAARALGVDAVELDIQVTADGVVVAAHDETVDRVSNGVGRVRDHSWTGLGELDAGYAFSPDGGRTHPFRGRGVRFPSLEEVARALPDLGLSVEIKPPEAEVADRVLELVRDLRLETQVCVGSFHHRVIDRIRARAPDVATSATRREVRRFHVLRRLGLARLHRDGADAFAVPEQAGGHRLVTPSAVRALHRLGRTVHVWTVDDPADMHRLLAWGVDGLITDRPDRAMASARAGEG